MPAEINYVGRHYLAGAQLFTIKLIEYTIFQTIINREEIIRSEA